MTDATDWVPIRRWRPVLALLVAVSLLAAGVGPVAAQDSPTETGVNVDVQESGTVDLTIVLTYDLATETERTAFEAVRGDETIRQEVEARFADRMERVATASADATGREVTVSDVSVSIETADSTGIVRLTATFNNLAAVDGDQIKLTQPFADGFQTDEPVRISLPDGYTIDSIAPDPATTSDGTLLWDGAAVLDGFELVASEKPAATTGTAVPGMGLLAAGIALTGATVLAVRRR